MGSLFRGVALAAGLASLALTSTVQADHGSHEWPRSYWYVGIEGSYYDIQKGKDKIGDVHNFWRPAINLGYRFNEHFSAQLQYGHMDTEARNFDSDVTHRQALLKGRLHWNEFDWFTFHPYLGLGYAYHELDPDINIGTTRENMVVLEAGAQRLLGQHFMLDVGYRHLIETSEPFVDRQPYLAINYRFGQRFHEQPEPEPEPVKEEMPWVDSDGDGVPDHLDRCPGTPAGAKVDEHGCHLTLTESVHKTLHIEFAFDSTEVPARFKPEIGEIAEVMVEYPDSVVVLEGHTDNIGRSGYNQTLSQSRADAVMRVLVSDFGIDPKRIRTTGMGLSQPIADNSTDEGRARNRRVEAVIQAEREVIQTK